MIDIFVINQVDYSIIVIGTIGILVFFSIQFALCMKAKKTSTKRIPLFVLLGSAVLCAATGFGLLGSPPAGTVSGNGFVALVMGGVIGIAAVGDLIAWIIYGVVRHIKNQKS